MYVAAIIMINWWV